jgi:uncharacterized protein YneF (UPF0154 family)
MDMFICRGFFNNPLDVALVVDPCQDQRGWFHWQTATGQERRYRNSGFYLFDSRHRLPQLQRAADLLHAAESDMSSTQPFSSVRSRTGRMLSSAESHDQATPSQVFISQPDQTWPMICLMGMLSLQTILMAMIGWSVWTAPRASGDSNPSRDEVYREVLTSLIESGDPSSSPPLSKQRLESLLKRQQEVQDLTAQTKLFQVAAEASQQKVQETTRQLEASSVELQKAHAINRDLDARVKALEIAQKETTENGNTALTSWWNSPWINTLIGATGLVLGGAIGGWWISRRQGDLELDAKD